MQHADHDDIAVPESPLCATIVEYDNAPNECTIFPREASGLRQMTTWITAKEGSFIDLESSI